jgi:regulator of sigma E protease
VSWFLAFAGFALLIVLHELGHFAVAKAVGMRVEKFSLFFPPTILSRKRGETEYALGAIPAGGYVKITGMNPNEDLPDEVRTRAYYSQPVWKRIAVISAGPLVNAVLAFVLLLVFFAAIGPETASTKVGVIEKDYPAAEVLKPGDRIVSIDGRAVTAGDIPERISDSRGQPILLSVEREGREVRVGPVRPRRDQGVYRLGFVLRGEGLSGGEAVSASVRLTADVTAEIGRSLGRLVTGSGRDEVSSPVGIVQGSSAALDQSVQNFLWVMGLLSLSLALLNLLPLLPLDGGHITFSIIEGIRGRAVGRGVYERVSVVGIALVLLLFFIGLSNDVNRLGGG